MKTLIYGAIGCVVGIIGLTLWFKQFLYILAGTIPILLLLGGGFAAYLGFDELKDSWKKKDDTKDIGSLAQDRDREIDKYKKEIDELKKEQLKIVDGEVECPSLSFWDFLLSRQR